jgi:hypothetical protein
MSRAIRDASLTTAAVVFGVNNSNTSTAAIDLGAVTPFPVTENLTAQIVTTAATNGANNKNVNITVQHSNVNTAANFTNLVTAALVIPEVGAAYAASTANVALPPNTKQFVRLLCQTENAGGNPNDGTATLRLAF